MLSKGAYIVVVGTDFSKQSEKALAVAYTQASRSLPAELHVVHVSSGASFEIRLPLDSLFVGQVAVPTFSFDDERARLLRHVEDVLGPMRALHGPQVSIVAHTVLNAPALGISCLAAELNADLIVVGSAGRRGVARWLLGSVAASVLRLANRPVLVALSESNGQLAPREESVCANCADVRSASAGRDMWCEPHRALRARNHVYFQADGSDTEMRV